MDVGIQGFCEMLNGVKRVISPIKSFSSKLSNNVINNINDSDDLYNGHTGKEISNGIFK